MINHSKLQLIEWDQNGLFNNTNTRSGNLKIKSVVVLTCQRTSLLRHKYETKLKNIIQVNQMVNVGLNHFLQNGSLY